MVADSNFITLVASSHPTKAVTIFQSSTAEVTRQFTVSLQGGRNVIEISGVSDNIDVESPRIHGLSRDVRVLDVSCNKSTPNGHQGRNTKHAEELKERKAKRENMFAERQLRSRELTLVDEGAATAVKNIHQLDLLDHFLERRRAITKALQELDEQLYALDREILLLESGYAGKSGASVVTTLIAKRETHATFYLTYLVGGVSWRPSYDLHAITIDGNTSRNVSLLYCTNIIQRTGEDWNNITLTLSTANSQTLQSLSVPTLAPVTLTPLHPTLARRPPRRPPTECDTVPEDFTPPSRFYSRSPSPLIDQSPPEVYPAYRGPAPVPAQAPPDGWIPTHGAAVSDHNPFAIAYRVEGDVTLASDGLAHRIAIAALSFEAELQYVCVPRLNTAVFIEASVTNTSEYELLAGPVSVFMDGGFVTKTSLGLIAVNESFKCVLGVDTALSITYHNSSRTVHEPARSFAEPTKTTTCTAVTTVANKHQFEISGLVVRDTVPLGNGEAEIKVMLRKPDGLAHAKEGEEVAVVLDGDVKEAKVRWAKVDDGKGGEKDGMYEWVCGIPAGGKAQLDAEWDVKAPGGLNWNVR